MASKRSRQPSPSRPSPYSLPSPSSFASLAAFTQHVVSSRSTPAAVRSTLSSARSLLGPDAYELLISLLTAAQPSSADIAAALAEVRPFALEHDRERRQAKLRLVQPRRAQQQGEPQQQADQLRPQLDERAMAQLQRSLVAISKYIRPTPTPGSGNDTAVARNASGQPTTTASSSTPPSPPASHRPAPARSAARSHNPTRQLLGQLSGLLPALHFQALLRCFLAHASTPLSHLKRQERHLAAIRDIVTAAAVKDDKGWQAMYGQYKGLRRRSALEESVCFEWLQDVDEAELCKLLPQAAEMEKAIQERRSKVPQQHDAERKELDKKERAKEKEAAAELERARLSAIMCRTASLSLPAPPPLPAYFASSPFPIDAAALPTSFLPPPDWTVAAMRCLEALQAACHPLAYWHFRSYMALLAAGPAAEMAAASSVSAVLSSVKSYCSLLLPESELLATLASQLPTFLNLSAPPLPSHKRVMKPSPPLTSLPSVPSFDLPLERHAFLCHLHREVVPAQSSELFLSWWRWQLTLEEAERRGERLAEDDDDQHIPTGAAAEVDQSASAEMRGLDEEISRLQRRRRAQRAQVDAADGAVTTAATGETDKKLAEKPAESKPSKAVAYSRLTVLNAAARVFGNSSPLLFLLRLHMRALTYPEWSEARTRLSAESEYHDYIGFFVDESATVPQPAPAPSVYHQRYNNQLLESNPALVFVHSPAAPATASATAASASPAALSAVEAFSLFRSRHLASKLFLSNLPADMSARELMFALRRIGDVRGGELFREKQRITSVERDMMAERERREKAAASPSPSSLSSYSSGGRKGHVLKVLRVAGDSPVYAAVYFASPAALEAAAEPSLQLFGLHYRRHSMYPLPATAVTRLTLTSPTLRHSFSFTHLVSHILALLVPAVLSSPSHVSVASRATLANSGYVTLTLRSHDEAVRVWEKLRGELYAGRRVRCSWAWENRDKIATGKPGELDRDKPAVENDLTKDAARTIRDADVVDDLSRLRADERM